MSTQSNQVRLIRAGNKLDGALPYGITPNRTLFSAMGVLVGSGVIGLAFSATDAKARSALDDMAWAPQQSRLTQPAASVDNNMDGAVALARAIAPGAPRAQPVAVAPAAAAVYESPQAVAVSRAIEANPAAMQPLQASASEAVQPSAARSGASLPPLSGSFAQAFANAGIVQASQQPAVPAVQAAVPQIAVPASAAASAPSAPRPEFTATNSARIGMAQSPIRAVSPAQTASAVSPRMPNVLSDLQSLRGSLATGSTAQADSDSSSVSGAGMANKVSVQATLDARSAMVMANPPAGIRRTVRTMRSNDQTYSDWLDDGSTSRSVLDTAVVPEQAVRAALRNAADAAAARSPALKQARNDWDAAKFDIDQVKGQRYPQIQVGANSPAITGDSASFNQYNRPTASVAITTLIYDFGKTSKSIDSRTKTAQAAELYYQTLAQQNAYDTSSSLVELAKNRAVYAIGENYVKRMSQLVQMLEEIVKADPGRLSELTQAQARLLQAQTSQATVAAQVRTQEIAVRKLVGEEPTPMPGGVHWQFMLDGVDSAVSAVAQNPAIAQADAEAEAAKLNAQSVRADSMPKLNWVINKNTAPDVFGNRQPWSTMLQLSWTPFQGGSQRAAERAALSRASSSLDKRDQLALDSEFKVRDAYHDALAMSTRAKLYDQLSTESDLIRKQFFEQWYHLNRRTLLDVLSAESDFYNNQVSAVTTQFDAYQAVLKIHLNNGTLDSWLTGA
ncbi:TolC family protein [Caballeronia sp. LjRoot34]|uniref:TolC family protein n=1 Tax=Caballeronia sp. LjRoot34 TaxID=3342325 RepID=UPI003ECFC900